MKYCFVLFSFLFSSSLFCQVPEWSFLKIFAGKLWDYGNDIYIDKNNNHYITGSFQNGQVFGPDSLIVDCNGIAPHNFNGFNGFMLRYDSTRALNLSITTGSALSSVRVDDTGNIFLSGTISYNSSRDGMLSKYTAAGNLVWVKYLESIKNDGRISDDVIVSMEMSKKDGSMVVTGFSYGQQVSVFGHLIPGPTNFITKLDTQGKVIWIHHFSSTLGRGIYKAKFDDNGDIIIAGNEEPSGNVYLLQAVIGKLWGQNGDLAWKKSFPTNGNYVPGITSIASYNNSYVFGGIFGGQITVIDTTYNSFGNLDIILLKTDTSGNINWVKQGGSSEREKMGNLTTGSDGIIYVTGGFSNNFKYDALNLPSRGNLDVFIMALDTLGKVIWEKHGGSIISGHTNDLFYDEYGNAITLDSKKQIHVVGSTIGNGNFGSLVYNANENAKLNAFWLVLGNHSLKDTINYPCNKELNADFAITVSPNPFIDRITIKNSREQIVTYNIILTNALGQKILHKRITSYELVIDDWKELASGVYFLTVQVDDYKKVFKLIKPKGFY